MNILVSKETVQHNLSIIGIGERRFDYNNSTYGSYAGYSRSSMFLREKDEIGCVLTSKDILYRLEWLTPQEAEYIVQFFDPREHIFVIAHEVPDPASWYESYGYYYEATVGTNLKKLCCCLLVVCEKCHIPPLREKIAKKLSPEEPEDCVLGEPFQMEINHEGKLRYRSLKTGISNFSISDLLELDNPSTQFSNELLNDFPDY